MSPNPAAPLDRPGARFPRRARAATLVTLGLLGLLGLLRPAPAHAQGTLVPGEMATGAISPVGDADTWTFHANAGDAIVVRAGEITQVNAFTPHLRLFNPSGTLLATSNAASAAEVAVTAAVSGTFSVIMDDLNGTNATGTYRLTLALSGAAIGVTAGDQGGPLTNGAMATGTIDVGDLDVWTVSATAGDAIVVRMGEVGAGTLTPGLRIYSPAGASLDVSSAPNAAEVAVTAPLTGTYMVVAGDNAVGIGGAGDYRLTLAQSGHAVTVSPSDQGGPLTNGAMASGTVDVGDLDVWTVDALAGAAIIVRMGEVGVGTLTPGLRIYSPAGANLDVSSAASAAEVAVAAPATGTYLVVVGDNTVGIGGAGDYRITLAMTGAPVTVSPSDQGGPLTNGAMASGTIDVGDLDVWTVSATAGDAIVVRMGEVGAGTLTPGLRLYSPTGASLGTSSAVSAAEVVASAPVTGTYLVIAGDNTVGIGGAGGYRLTLATTGAPVTVSPSDQGGPLTNGAAAGGTIDVGDLDVWTVGATAGDAIVVRMGEASAGTLTPGLRLYSPAGVLLSSGSAVSAAEVVGSAPVTGTYLVIVGDNTVGIGGAGDYRITLAQSGVAVTVTGGDQGGPLANGEMASGTIDVGELDAWTVSANAGDAIVVRMGEVGAGTLTPGLRLYSPAGALLSTSSAASAAEVVASAPVTGTYLVIAGDNTVGIGGAGGYRLTLAQSGTVVGVSPSDQGGPLTNGAMATGMIDVGDLDAWTVSASAGDAIVVRMGEVTAGTLTPGLRLYSPTGVLLGNSSAATAAEVAATAPITGTYLVIAGDNTVGIGGAGDYRLTLAKTGAAVTVSPADEGGPLNPGNSTGVIPVGDLDLWTLTATAGQPLIVTCEEVVIGSALTPALRLYSPSGALLKSSSGASWCQVTATAPISGTYLVVVGDNTVGIGGSGGYRLTPSATTGAEELALPTVLALAPAAPNPFVSRTVLHYDLPAATPVAMRLYDAQGRLVRTLLEPHTQDAGRYSVAWDGLDAQGRGVSPGLYFARLDAGGRREVQKVMLAR